MWEWLRRGLAHVRRLIAQDRDTYERHWRRTTNRPMTLMEIAAMDRAFEKFEDGFRELDRVFGEDWGR